jgi:hypothetical protein
MTAAISSEQWRAMLMNRKGHGDRLLIAVQAQQTGAARRDVDD